jgi:sec-independent protein translocase protein TatB
VFNLGASEIGVILVVALLFLGPKMLPEIATVLGKIIREFRKATADIRQDIELDDVIRKPLQELRDAATLPPEELKRRDEAKAALRKAELAAKEAEDKRKHEAEDAERKQRAAKAAAEANAKRQQEMEKAAAAVAAVLPSAAPSEVVSAGGTMIANPPPAEDLQTLTPLPDLHSPPPTLMSPPARLPLPPPVPRPTRPSVAAMDTVSEATVIDLHAQLKASAGAQATTVMGRPGPATPGATVKPALAKTALAPAKPTATPTTPGNGESKKG